MGVKQYQNNNTSASNLESLLASIITSDTWFCETFTKAQALIDLVWLQVNGENFTVSSLSNRWSWSRTKVYSFLEQCASRQGDETQKDTQKNSVENSKKITQKDAEKNTESDSSNYAITLRESAPNDTQVEEKKSVKKALIKTGKKAEKKTPKKTGAPYIYNNISNILNNNIYNNKYNNYLKNIGEIGRVQRGEENQNLLLQNQNKLDTPQELDSLPPTPSSAEPLPPKRLTKKSAPLEPVDPENYVWLTESEYDQLNERYGKAWFKLMLTDMVLYAKTSPAKWNAYKDHNAVFHRWSMNKQSQNFTAIEEADGSYRWQKNYQQNQGVR